MMMKKNTTEGEKENDLMTIYMDRKTSRFLLVPRGGLLQAGLSSSQAGLRGLQSPFPYFIKANS
jgi:hypothetical protein